MTDGLTADQVSKLLTDMDFAVASHKKQAKERGLNLSEFQQGYVRALADFAKEIRRLRDS